MIIVLISNDSDHEIIRICWHEIKNCVSKKIYLLIKEINENYSFVLKYGIICANQDHPWSTNMPKYSHFPITIKTEESRATVTIDFKALAVASEKKDMDAKKRAYGELLEQLKGFPGELHWRTIASDLIPEACRGSLATQQLALSFIELLKNSLDAAIIRREEDNHAPTTVDVIVKVDLSHKDNITISITDNAGGMSKSELEKANRYCSSKENFKDGLSSGSSKAIGFYFGGAGIGLKMLIARISYLSTLEGSKLEKTYILSNKDEPHKIRFSNIEHTTENELQLKGLRITITTPRAVLEEVDNLGCETKKDCATAGSCTTENPNRFFSKPAPFLLGPVPPKKNRHKRRFKAVLYKEPPTANTSAAPAI